MDKLLLLKKQILNLKKIESEVGINKEKIAAYNEVLILIKRLNGKSI